MRYSEHGKVCYSEDMAIFISKDSLPAVRKVEAAPTGRQLYVWMDDGRSGMVDLSDWKGYLRGKWDEEGFDTGEWTTVWPAGAKTATSAPIFVPQRWSKCHMRSGVPPANPFFLFSSNI